MAEKKRFNLTSVLITMKTTDGIDINVGTAESVSVTITPESFVAHQANQKLPAELVDGFINIKGSVTRATVDFDSLKLINKTGINPEFNLVATENISGKTMIITGCKQHGDITFDIALDNWVKDTINFNAKDYKFV